MENSIKKVLTEEDRVAAVNIEGTGTCFTKNRSRILINN